MITKEKVIEVLETVLDPELGIDVWTMGLIYDINIKDDKEVKILMTLTTPMCPLGDELRSDIYASLKQLGFDKIHIEMTFDPPWTPPHKLKEMFGSH